MTMHERKTIDLEQGCEFMQKGITKPKNILEGLPEPQFSSEDHLQYLHSETPSRLLAAALDKHRESLEEYITATPDFKAIKKRIEDLITRDYLERDKENANMYKYLA